MNSQASSGHLYGQIDGQSATRTYATASEVAVQSPSPLANVFHARDNVESLESRLNGIASRLAGHDVKPTVEGMCSDAAGVAFAAGGAAIEISYAVYRMHEALNSLDALTNV